jgi:hypothetical protein
MAIEQKTYIVEFVEGWNAETHFGREIAATLREAGQPIRFATMAEARKALKEARKGYKRHQAGRFDIVEMFGDKEVRHHRWE